jgi:large subunit ribosomal protein L11
MPKKPIKTTMKLQIEAGKATPAPPIGPALSQHGVNIQDFCSRFNDLTSDKQGDVIPCILTVYDDRTFSIELKTPPVASLIKKKMKLKKGSGEPNKKKIGVITNDLVKEIAEEKMVDLNTRNIESAMNIVKGTAKSMGLQTED